jgi:hypothetical protein
MSDYYLKHVRPCPPRELGQKGKRATYATTRSMHIYFKDYGNIRENIGRKPRISLREMAAAYPITKHFSDAGRVYAKIPNLRLHMMLINEVERMRGEIKILNTRLASIENTSEKELEIRDISFDEAKTIVKKFLKDYLKEHPQIYPSDVADELGLKYERVREVFDSLEKEGKLKRKGE